MEYVKINKFKVFNDPVHGFINIPNELIFDLIEHRHFQRLRRICQTALTEMVYPGAKHSRFHHALGCMGLMQRAIETLKMKGVKISAEEEKAVYCAILLHDIGHGPFSHTLENSLIDVSHEKISLLLMEELNMHFSGELSLAIRIFKGNYEKKFLTQLVSSQIDIDRLDYLKRDSFYTGVVEGSINPQRIISMMNVSDNQLVIDSKGILSIEKYLIARMFMYWQVYYHKTSFSAELYLIEALKRAKILVQNGEKLFATEAFSYFLNKKISSNLTKEDLHYFVQLDDSDIIISLKEWQKSKDSTLSYFSKSIVNRSLPKSIIQNKKLTEEELNQLKIKANKELKIEEKTSFAKQTEISVLPYDNSVNPIKILYRDGLVREISESEHQIFSNNLMQETTKYHICYSKDENNKI